MGLPASVIVVVGDELLAGFTVDANGALAARRLFETGYPVRRIEIVSDTLTEIVAAIRRAVEDPGVTRVLVCGGVGPTPDDRTHGAVAAALDRELVENPEALRHVEALVARMHAAGWVESPVARGPNREMAHVAAGGRVLENRRGMAPPMAYELGADRWLFVLPGVPREFAAILEEVLIPDFFSGSQAPTVVELRYPSAIEAEFAEPMRQLETEFPEVTVGSYPQQHARELLIRLRGQDPGRVDEAALRLRQLRPDRKPRD